MKVKLEKVDPEPLNFAADRVRCCYGRKRAILKIGPIHCFQNMVDWLGPHFLLTTGLRQWCCSAPVFSQLMLLE